MKKKVLSLFLCIAMVTASLAGCSNNDNKETTEKVTEKDSATEKPTEAENDTDSAEVTEAGEATEAGATGDEVTLKWAMWDRNLVTYWDDVANAYMEANPGVKIELVDLGSNDYQTVLATELSGSGSDFDIVTIKDVPGYATLVAKGVLEPINSLVADDGIDLSVYNGTTDQVLVNDELYELPFRSDFWVLYYNKDVFDAAGVEYPTNDMTLEAYDELARNVASSGFGDDQVYGAHYHTWRSAVQLFGILDGEHSVLDGSYAWTQEYYEMVKSQEEDGITRSYVDINASSLHYSAAFAEGNTATLNMGSWYISTLISNLDSGEYDAELVGNWGIVKYPHPEGIEAGTTLGTITGLAIPTASKNTDLAWDFIKFACGEEGASILASTGTFPAIFNDNVIEQLSSVSGFPTDEASKEALNTYQIYLEAPYDENIAEINTILDTYHKDIMNGDTSVADGIESMNSAVSELVE